MNIQEKIADLKNRLRKLGKVAVAFSGGKDSFYLLKTAVETLGKDRVFAYFVETALLTRKDRQRVDYFREILDFKLEILSLYIEKEEKIMSNPVDRCYHCKKKIFRSLLDTAAAAGVEYLLDGTTYSDLDEYRPGLRALEELKVLSPMKDAGITSREVVSTLAGLGIIDDYFLTSSTCLATRFPYDHALDTTTLKQFAEIETYFIDNGIYPVRIRYIDKGIRIETEAKNFARVLEKKDALMRFCKERGKKFITLDLEGLRSGVWDES